MRTTVDDEQPHRCKNCPQTGVPWRPIVWVLAGVALWDTVGLAVGDAFYTAMSYDVLRSWTPNGLGMRAYALLLGPLFAGMAFGLYRWERHRRRTRLLAWMLSCAAAWWVCWSLGIALSFIEHRSIYAWGSLGKLAGIAAIAWLTARVPPPPRTPNGS